MRVGVDTGGTFTDVVAADGRIAKVPSTPHDPGEAVRSGAALVIADGRPGVLAHGTTVATNALLERRGATVALVTTAGFADVIEIARQDRPSLYDPWADRPEPLVPRDLRLEVGGRLDADGAELEPVPIDGIPEVPAGVGSVAVCLLHSDLDDTHELGWVANRAHHADLGGAAPGSLPADATEIQQEGLRIPPVLLTPDVAAIVAASSRTPAERAGDLDAQIGANRLGVERFAALAHHPLGEVVAYGERRMRAALADLPDGTWRFSDVLDSYGPNPEQQVPTTIRVALTVAGDEVTFDFTGTDPQRRGNVNAVEAVTVSAVAWALRSVLDPTIPANGGALAAVRVVAPSGSVVAAQAPAAVGAGNVEVSQRVADVCLGALAQVVPDRVPAASQGTMNNLLLGGAGWVSYETVAGGQGGRPSRPGGGGAPVAGMSGVHTAMTNTRNTPTEAFERAFPVRVLRYALRRGSGGAGAAPGGDGIERDLEVLEPVTLSLITERRASAPWGLAGGEPGAVGENWLVPGGDEDRAERLPDKCTIQLQAGDVIRMRTPGGGAWGSLR